MIDTDLLRKYALTFNIDITQRELDQFSLYATILLDWNQKMNLTAITEPEDIVIKHFLDSLMLLPLLEKENTSLIDIGSGAGFPGIPLKIMRPSLNLTLLDSQEKKVDFLKFLSQSLDQKNLCIHGRAEALSRENAFREAFDYAVARAVASLNILCELSLPFIKQGGFFLACKGPGLEAEMTGIKEALAKLGGNIVDRLFINLPNENTRSIAVIKKISQTPAKYPRIYGKIVKSPL